MKSDELEKVMDDHALWLTGEGGSRANLRGADLRGADLRGADLWGANLEDANLEDANLRDANLRVANLRVANLRGANLRDANLLDANLLGASLRDANLRGANLLGANLWGAYLRSARGNGCQVKSTQLGTYDITYTATVMQIGCQRHPITDWWGFDDETIRNMDRDALDWWQVWKPILQTIIAASPAEATGKED